MNSDIAEETDVHCPFCNSEAIYKYGKIKSGKQRYLCIICSHQFTLPPKRFELRSKPVCPECARPMNIYMRRDDIIRFRCSGYPYCRTFIKLDMKEAMKNELLYA